MHDESERGAAHGTGAEALGRERNAVRWVFALVDQTYRKYVAVPLAHCSPLLRAVRYLEAPARFQALRLVEISPNAAQRFAQPHLSLHPHSRRRSLTGTKLRHRRLFPRGDTAHVLSLFRRSDFSRGSTDLQRSPSSMSLPRETNYRLQFRSLELVTSPPTLFRKGFGFHRAFAAACVARNNTGNFGGQIGSSAQSVLPVCSPLPLFMPSPGRKSPRFFTRHASATPSRYT
ncbi:hypothetical protein KCP69_04570 [Salmonella enterica subsp. enterica]|nr:hypothetical protein KCP69_04570 [Salmonella enterica subsp. enterica]